mmetsp:Transcript_31834/g.48828  ORF Transcript_31834/g.48828 Transcript_31834/m.48828 type:complete len:422 (+) Transcript_31834:165-1430(+)|eukprot:CAMPEP_0195299136 /NCGR_PEP_ID=MMETSP0707-20130614/24911_1 /TAXON_ID=33640 /ORGANISM="Asterionellopsis glacialis, Strain CCMP134" /LENGTH=421 /DNA_ID=CAMNT_0040361433 /DNA_START=143 /DNA_END=1408 /DNA_ORIENTATION=+
MGKRIRGAALRAKKRALALQEENYERQAHEASTKSIVQKSNEELFVLDTDGAPDSSRALQKEKIRQKKKQKGLSAMDSQKVKTLLEKHEGDAQKLESLAKSKDKRIQQAIRTKRVLGNARAGFDLWDDSTTPKALTKKSPDTIHPPKPKKQKKMDSGIGMALAGTSPAFTPTTSTLQKITKKKNTVAVDTAHGGQSYHPDPQQHQDMIGEALSLELRRKQAIDYNKAPISQGLSEETKALMVTEEESDSSDDDDSSGDEVDMVVVRKKEKLTRAQRNRQKRIRAEQAALDEKKRQKKLLNAVHDVKQMKKDLAQMAREKKERKEWIQLQKQQEEEKPAGTNILEKRAEQDPIRVSALPVALTEELGGSLRTLKPKGSLVTDRIDSLVDRKMANRKYVGDKKKVVQGKKRKVRNKDLPYLLE